MLRQHKILSPITFNQGSLKTIKLRRERVGRWAVLWTDLPTPLTHLYVEALTLNMTVFGDGSFNKVIKVK